MDATHLHLLLNHFPIIGTLIGTVIIIYGFIKNESKIKELSAYIIAAMAIIALPVFFTGEPAEERIENIAGIAESAIELHEEAAEFAIILMSITGLFAIVSLIVAKIKPAVSNKFFVVVLLFSILSFISMARVGYLGGKIRHTELNTSTTNQSLPANGGEQEEED
jgi:uncharacterized membrane protein